MHDVRSLREAIGTAARNVVAEPEDVPRLGCRWMITRGVNSYSVILAFHVGQT